MFHLLRFHPVAKVMMKRRRRRESGARKKCVLIENKIAIIKLD